MGAPVQQLWEPLRVMDPLLKTYSLKLYIEEVFAIKAIVLCIKH